MSFATDTYNSTLQTLANAAQTTASATVDKYLGKLAPASSPAPAQPSQPQVQTAGGFRMPKWGWFALAGVAVLGLVFFVFRRK